ncbi:Hint domain-containing protein [Asaia sp. HN010]|uniref:Hint domain-containing protein n=1 Tax=Asaia sp. HN010 TaxID=3081233 RepID=UPI0030171039
MAITSTGSASGATIISSGGKYSVLSGATLVVQNGGFVVSGAVVSGFGNGPNNSGAIPGQSGGTNYPALIIASAGGIASGSTVGFGGVVMGANGGTAAGGTAIDSGSFAAVNGGFVSGATVGSNGGVLASMVSGSGGGAGVVIDTHVQAGGYALAGGGFTIKGQAFAGSGVVSKGTFDIGSTEILASAGTDIGSIVGGTQLVSSAGVAISSIFSAGTQIVGAGGWTSGATAYAGGRIEVSGGWATNIVLNSGGSFRATAGAQLTGLQVGAAAAASAEAASILSNVVISGGGTLTLGSGATLINATVSGLTSSGGAGGLLVLQSGAVLSGITSMGFKSRLDIDSVQYVSGAKTTYSGNTLTITDANGNVLWTGSVASIPAGGTSKDFHIERDAADGSLIVVYDKCFLKGTMIRTEQGEQLVEDLAVGDRVVACVDGKEVLREVIWVGRRTATVRPGPHDDEAGYPVRIVRGALGDNVPYKDLLVTPEHALFLNDAFVPARMLVNGRSIYYDRTLAHFDYYHIETDEHSVLWSDGAMSESYLDTGDRSAFSQDGPVVRLLNAPARTWEHDAAAPLRVERSFVEPIFEALSQRAATLSIGVERPDVEMTDDANLRLVDHQGREIRPLRTVKQAYIFMIPAGARGLHLLSRVARPLDVVGPFLDDRRHLGVLVGEIQIWEAGQTHQIDDHLGSASLSGWSNVEDGRRRWTTGCAELPLSDLDSDAIAMISIEILAGGPYPIASDAVEGNQGAMPSRM